MKTNYTCTNSYFNCFAVSILSQTYAHRFENAIDMVTPTCRQCGCNLNPGKETFIYCSHCLKDDAGKPKEYNDEP